MIHDIELGGCAPVPLAYYLKSLGVLRLVAEQTDMGAKGFWRGDAFVLRSILDKESLVRFFLRDYRPTPIVAPWNGGSGFYFREEKLCEKDPVTGKKKKTGRRNLPTAATRVVDALLTSSSHRLDSYRESLVVSKELVRKMGFEKAPVEEAKMECIQTLRGRLPDLAITWLDASVVLTEEKPRYPPLLGTGGNDGDAEFSSNFMQRLCDVMDLCNGMPTDDASTWLQGALFADTMDGLLKGVAVGQFLPCAAGRVNAEFGFDSKSLVNPWDYILMVEGALLFAATAAKRMESSEPGVLSYPFSVHTSGVGYGSASQADESTDNSRAEIWVPLWDRPTSVNELKALMSEGRAQVGPRFARNGVDFARAVATLGVDRGISSFQRYGFQVRNGRAYFATPLNRFQVRRQPQVNLLSDVDKWLDSCIRRVNSRNAPASVSRALRQLEETILVLCKERGPPRTQDVLIALGECEKVLVKSNKWARDEKSFVSPIPPLSPNWLKEADDGSPEFRLASSLASLHGQYRNRKGREYWMSIRTQVEPIRTWMKEGRSGVTWNDEGTADIGWSDGDPVRVLNAIMSRRIILAVQSGADAYPDKGRLDAELGDIADFIEGRVDLRRMASLLWGLMLLDWPKVTENALTRICRSEAVFPGAGYGLMKLCFSGREVKGVRVPIVPEIHRRAALGDGAGATQLAVRRLRGSGFSVPVGTVSLSRESAQRTAAALIFPVDDYQLSRLADKVLRRGVECDEKEV